MHPVNRALFIALPAPGRRRVLLAALKPYLSDRDLMSAIRDTLTADEIQVLNELIKEGLRP